MVNNGKLKGIKSVKIQYPGKSKKITLKKTMYDQSNADPITGTIQISGKGNYTGTVIVVVTK